MHIDDRIRFLKRAAAVSKSNDNLVIECDESDREFLIANGYAPEAIVKYMGVTLKQV